MSNFLPAKLRGFKMACLDINNLVKHVDTLRVFLAEFSFDILAINKTKLDEFIKSSEIHIPGYEFIHRDKNIHGGGVGFYIKSSNSYIVRSDLNLINLENLTVEIHKPNSKPFLVARDRVQTSLFSNRFIFELLVIYRQIRFSRSRVLFVR